MNAYYTTRWRLPTILVALGATIGWNHQISAQQLPAPDQEGMEILTRGPVHEAFAATITFNPEPGLVAPKAPPADIEELPPDHRPEGADLTWIPGYWAWDDERNDHLWVSGIWRALPPGRQWVPGYWGESRQGAQWTSGYWADAATDEIDYLPEPPATVETGPSIAASSADEMWLPGVWRWQQNRYAWRPGYWTQGHQDWDWIPDHYVWTPRGYVFVDGYYDYSVARRGVVFAPVYFNRGFRTRRGFTYSPSIVVNPVVFGSHLFLRPSYGHYYFGDYYGSSYTSRGFSPWISFHTNHRGYDPFYVNQRWQHRRDRRWRQRLETNYRTFSEGETARLPRNWAEQRELASSGETSNLMTTAIVAPLQELTQQEDSPLRFQSVAPEERQRFGQRRQEYRSYLEQRKQLEAAEVRSAGEEADAADWPSRRRLGRSPFVATPVEQLDPNNAPPRRQEVLRPTIQVELRPRVRGEQPDGSRRFRREAAGGSQQQVLQDSQTRRDDGAQRQPQGQAVPQDDRQGAAAAQSRDQGASRGSKREASSDQPQRSRRFQRRDESEEEEKD